MSEDLPVVLNPKQTSELLGVGLTVTYGLLRSGKIPAVRVGSQWRVPTAALLRYLEAEADKTTARDE